MIQYFQASFRAKNQEGKQKDESNCIDGIEEFLESSIYVVETVSLCKAYG